MRILIVIPHFYRPEEKSSFGSLEKNPDNRIAAFTAMLHALYQNFRSPHCLMNIADHTMIPANQAEHNHLDIAICTTGEHHILNQLPIPAAWYKHYSTNAEPRLLGFECHAVMRDALAKQYDYYCFMEDDLVIHDPMFFRKLKWFNQQTGSQNLLQPHLYELSPHGPFFKGYLNGEINPRAAAHLQNIRENFEIRGNVMGEPVLFRRTTNPHSGCFFLNAEQMKYWAEQPYFLDRDISFVDPMASAATLAVTKTFKVYKPAAENAYFLEIEHRHSRYLRLVGSTVSIAKDKFTQLGYRFTK